MSLINTQRITTITSKDINLVVNSCYQSAVVNLVYSMIDTQVDITYVMGVINQYMTNLKPLHWIVVKWTFTT